MAKKTKPKRKKVGPSYPRPATDLENLIFKAFVAQILQGGGDFLSVRRWARHTAKRINRLNSKKR